MAALLGHVVNHLEALAVSRRCGAKNLARRRPALSRPRHQSRGARPARRANAAGGGEDRPPRPDRVPLHRSGAHLEGSRAAARVPRRPRTARKAARSITRSGSPRVTPASRTSGTRGPRRRGCSAPRTAASPGSRSPRSTTIRSTANGWAPCRTARRTGRSCTRSSSTRAIPRICTSACRAAACTSRSTAAGPGRRS